MINKNLFYLIFFPIFIINICYAEISIDQLKVFYNEYNQSSKSSDIIFAIEKGYSEIASYLIPKKSSSEINQAYPEGTALTFAIKNRENKIVELLLNCGADVNIFNGTPLKYAVWHSNTDLANSLIRKGANPSFAITEACRLGNIEITKLLLDAGADPAKGIHFACENAQFQVVKTLLDSGINIALIRKTIFTSAIDGYKHNAKDATAIAELLIERGCYPNQILDSGITNLHYAAKYNAVGIAQLLIDFGLNVNQQDNNKYTPTQEAVTGGHVEMTSLLILHGGNVNYTIMGNWLAFDNNFSILGYAIMKGTPNHLECAKLILENCGDPNIKDGAGITPLLLALKERNIEAVQLLLDFGAKPDLVCNYSWYNKHKNMVENICITPIKLALETGQSQIYELLLNAQIYQIH